MNLFAHGLRLAPGCKFSTDYAVENTRPRNFNLFGRLWLKASQNLIAFRKTLPLAVYFRRIPHRSHVNRKPLGGG